MGTFLTSGILLNRSDAFFRACLFLRSTCYSGHIPFVANIFVSRTSDRVLWSVGQFVYIPTVTIKYTVVASAYGLIIQYTPI